MRNPSDKTSNSMVQKIAAMRDELTVRFTVKRIGVFGSSTSGEDTPENYVDILVEFEAPTLDHYMDLRFRIEEVLRPPVDLVIASTVKPRLKPIIEGKPSLRV